MMRAAQLAFGRYEMLRGSKAAFGFAIFIAAVLAAATAGWIAIRASSIASSMEIVGYAGHLGEWELTAQLSKDDSGKGYDLSGPLKLKHVGFCSNEGPVEKAGNMRISLSRLSSRFDAALTIDGVECSHSADFTGATPGAMICSERKPIPLSIWVK